MSDSDYTVINRYCRQSEIPVQEKEILQRLYSEIYDVHASGTAASNELENLLNITGFVEYDKALNFFEQIGCKFNQRGSGYSKKNYSKKRRKSKRRSSKRRTSKRRKSKRRVYY